MKALCEKNEDQQRQIEMQGEYIHGLKHVLMVMCAEYQKLKQTTDELMEKEERLALSDETIEAVGMFLEGCHETRGILPPSQASTSTITITEVNGSELTELRESMVKLEGRDKKREEDMVQMKKEMDEMRTQMAKLLQFAREEVTQKTASPTFF